MERKCIRPAQVEGELIPPQPSHPRALRPGEDKHTRRAIAAVQEDKRVGRKTYYREEFDELVYELRLAAVPLESIARILNVNAETLRSWQRIHPTFLAHWEAGGELADARVGFALYNRATGFSRIVTKHAYNQKTGQLITWDEETYFPPDTKAAEFWLTNRRRDTWKNNSNQDITTGGVPLSAPSLQINFVPVSEEA